MAGYLEGIGSERGIAWRCRDSISLREFLGYGLAKTPPEHSTRLAHKLEVGVDMETGAVAGVSKTRKRLSLEARRKWWATGYHSNGVRLGAGTAATGGSGCCGGGARSWSGRSRTCS